MQHHFPEMVQFLSAGRLGYEMKLKSRLLPYPVIQFSVSTCFVFSFVIFYLQVNPAIVICSQQDQAYRVVANLISGIISSVDCSESITDLFTKVCSFCFSLVQRPIWKHACKILFTDKALLTKVQGSNLKKKVLLYSLKIMVTTTDKPFLSVILTLT